MEVWDGWEYAESVELLDAAYLLSVTRPHPGIHNRILPAKVGAMLRTLEQAVLLGQLPVFAAWVWNENGDREPINADDVTPHTSLHSCTTVRARDLAAWCDARCIPHYWFSANTSAPEAIATYPDELRAAIEAFQAVHTDPARLRGRSPKTVLAEWLEKNKPELSASARERIATVANWQREGGAPKTPDK